MEEKANWLIKFVIKGTLEDQVKATAHISFLLDNKGFDYIYAGQENLTELREAKNKSNLLQTREGA